MFKDRIVRVTTDLFLFHQPDFVHRQGSSQILTFSANGICIYFTFLNQQLISLSKSPFGGFSIPAGYDENKISIVDLVTRIEQYASQQQITSIEIRCHPDVYNPKVAEVVNKQLTDAAYRVLYQDITQVLLVASREPDFNVHRKRRMRQCLEAGFVFEQLTIAGLPEAYTLIEESRNSKGYPVTMSLTELVDTMTLFPDHYLLFGVMDKDKMIATCLAIRVSSSVLYCFYIGDALSHRKLSPVTFLIRGIYDYCFTHHIALMDLGVSTERGVINAGLFTFKKSLGAQPSKKLTFKKGIA